MRSRPRFHPWRRDLAGAAWFSVSAWAMWISARRNPMYLLPGLVFLAAAWLALRSWRRRRYGKAVERRSSNALRWLWDGTVTTNVPVPGGGGDIDVVLETITQTGRRLRFAVEVKSWAGLRLARGRLVRFSGRPLGDKDPIAQVQREAASIGAIPVLWLPNAKRNAIFRHCGVLIVNGTPEYLVQTLRTG